jgi:hypothetical protein
MPNKGLDVRGGNDPAVAPRFRGSPVYRTLITAVDSHRRPRDASRVVTRPIPGYVLSEPPGDDATTRTGHPFRPCMIFGERP